MFRHGESLVNSSGCYAVASTLDLVSLPTKIREFFAVKNLLHSLRTTKFVTEKRCLITHIINH